MLTNFDKEFFASSEPKALTKGGIVGYHRQMHSVQRGADIVTSDGASVSSIGGSAAAGGKPWKKHFNRNKREKLRRQTSHFDRAEYL